MSHRRFHRPVHLWQRWLFIGAVALQMLMACASIVLLASVRVVGAGESLWSKAVGTAITDLDRYARNGQLQDFEKFQAHMGIPQALLQARQTLEAPQLDPKRLQESLLAGGIERVDVRTMRFVLPTVWNLSALSHLRAAWHATDTHLASLQTLAQDIHTQRQEARPPSAQRIAQWHDQLNTAHSAAKSFATDFSTQLNLHGRRLGWVLLVINVVTAALLCMLHWLTVLRAVRESQKANQALEAERLRSSVTLAALHDGVLTLDAEQRIRYANPATSELLGQPLSNLLGQSVAQVIPFAPNAITEQLNALKQPGWHKPNDSLVHWITREDASSVAVRLSVSPLHEASAGSVLVLHDVSQEQSYVRMLDWQQSHDLLTGLTNRAAFEQHVQQVLGKYPASLLHLNLDHFKMVNSSYGHAAGDELLRQVCQQLHLILRESDVLARIGGDEFAVLLCHCSPHASMQTAERLRQAVHDLHVQWRSRNIQTGVSIGVVHVSTTTSAPDTPSLLGMAESACKHAKESGRNRITVYNPFNRIFQRHQTDLEWVQHLRLCLEQDKFTLFAQTVYPLKTLDTSNANAGVHFEVLLRLFDGPGKQLSPAEFIPIAERYDLMIQIDRWVIRHTLRLLQTHLAAGTLISTCAINLSGTSLSNNDLPEFIRHCIAEYGIKPELLCFEITETSAIASMDSALALMNQLRALGCRFSLDDFGSGMASFRYLQQLPVDYLKIDGSFVCDMLKNPANYAMVEAISHIAHVMGKQTVAEFVGDHATFEALKTLGVDFAQGFYIAKPMLLDTNYFSVAQRVPPQTPPSAQQLYNTDAKTS